MNDRIKDIQERLKIGYHDEARGLWADSDVGFLLREVDRLYTMLAKMQSNSWVSGRASDSLDPDFF